MFARSHRGRTHDRARARATALALMLAGALVMATPALAAGTVNVLYAGSLINLMERNVGPAFTRATGDRFQGFGAGSNALANQIKGKLRRADVFISANPKVDASLMGASNGSWVSWYITFAQSPLVIGYNASSRFAADFSSKPWYEVLREPGIRIGRTDPKLDPKGALTLQLLQQAEQFYKIPGLAQQVLGPADNSAQILPEETLVGRLQSGELDAGFFYSTETADAAIPAQRLPPQITPKATYTITIVRDAADPAAARRFVGFLLGRNGQRLLRAHALSVQAPVVSGDASAVPHDIRTLIR